MIKEKLSPAKRTKAALRITKDYNTTLVCIHAGPRFYLRFDGFRVLHAKYYDFKAHFFDLDENTQPTFQL